MAATDLRIRINKLYRSTGPGGMTISSKNEKHVTPIFFDISVFIEHT